MKYSTLLLICSFLCIISCSITQEDQETNKPNLERYWAVHASASSAYGGVFGEQRDDQSPYAATGEPDAEECIDSPRAWVISSEDDGEHWLELQFEDDIFVKRVEVYESLGPGALTKIELKNNNNYVTFWEGIDDTEDCPGVFTANFKPTTNSTYGMTPFKTDTVKLTLNTDVKDWNEIDAVALYGYQDRWSEKNGSIVIDE